MLKLLREVDQLLRGQLTSEEDLKRGKIAIAARRLALLCLILGMFYGVFMGIYGATRGSHAAWQQLVASTVKVPLVFLLTLLVTFPSLYVFSALVGSRCRFIDTLRLLVASIGVTLAILASFGPITGFFTLSTTSYPFMVLLNVAFFGVAGIIGLGFLRRALERVIGEGLGGEAREEPKEPVEGFVTPVADAAGSDSAEGSRPSATDPKPAPAPAHTAPSWATPPRTESRRSSPAVIVFRLWVVIYGIVGAQMGWILRPFIGTPDTEFSWFRPRTGSFLAGVGKAIAGLFG
jgi:hypothetical protein